LYKKYFIAILTTNFIDS